MDESASALASTCTAAAEGCSTLFTREFQEVSVFIAYLLFMLAIGIYFFLRDRNGGEKTYFLGDRKMGAWVSGLSAGASDMSAWVLMGLPTAIYAQGMGQLWIPVGLAVGYTLSWIFEAPRLRKFTIAYGDAITVPQFLTNRFMVKSKALRVISALVFLIAYTVYSAASIKACGNLFHTVTNMDPKNAMYLGTVVIVGYTFLGGYSAVCWTDFFQGLLILGALFLVPIFAASALEPVSDSPALAPFWNGFSDWKTIISGLGWGLGYFGMPHIIVRFMGIKSHKELRKSSVIGISWTVLVVFFAALIGIVGRHCIGYSESTVSGELIFIQMVRTIFPALISGILLSAVLAAAMSTADSQLLAASSSFSCDVYKPALREDKANDAELLWVGRLLVLIVALAALLLASDPRTGSIMSLVSNAWSVFGSSFGPAILLSLFWRRFNFAGAVTGICVGAAVDIIWLFCLSSTGIYEILPGFAASLIASVIATLCTKAPEKDVTDLFQRALTHEDYD